MIYINKFKEAFAIEVNTSNRYELKYNSKEMKIVRRGFGSSDIVYTCRSDNKKVKDAYLQFLLCGCVVTEFVRVIGTHGGVAPDAWWLQTPPHY